ncbi:DUF4360 domain-containing protein [Actinomadura soli]|uniref:DUF4360 domain-containing protein n=1 Tax=Actinomadura soli TaxID=2508997 RepID=A0A5C4JI69_9ACTN|nr:DUF4360 domain-containing protein [Actinomadura soli]TMR06412.1 DUF4360 domain-containing protein [Actinomadura soli]
MSMKKTGRTVFTAMCATFALAALTTTPVAAEVSDPPPGSLTVEVASVGGPGCRTGTTAVAISDDKSRMTITRENIRAEAGGTSNPSAARVNCMLSVRVHIPADYTYAIRTFDYHGYAHLESGASGVLRSVASFQGMPNPSPRTFTLNGPFFDNWQWVVPDSGPVYKPCGEQRTLNLSADLRVLLGTSDPSKKSYMETDGREVYEFIWKKCPIT